MEQRTITIDKPWEGRTETSFGRKYHCGPRTNNLWFLVLTVEPSGRLVCEFPEGGDITLAVENKRSNKRPKLKKSYVKGLRRAGLPKPVARA